MIRFYDHDRKAYTSSIKINNETFFFLAILAYFQHLLNGWCFLVVAYPALRSILSDLDQLAHTHFDKHCYNTGTRLLYWGSRASKSMEPFFVTLGKLIAPSLRVWHQEGFARGERRSTPGHVLPLQAASECPCRGTLLALPVLGSMVFLPSHPSWQLRSWAAQICPSFDILSWGGNQQMQRKLNGQMNVKIIGATISDLMNMLLKLQLCLENKTKQKPWWM